MTFNVNDEDKLMFWLVGSVTGVVPALLSVTVEEPTLSTWMEYVPGRAPDDAVALRMDESETVAVAEPLAAEATL